MKIAQISTLDTTVKRVGAASVQSLVYLLTRELTQLGHDVTVFGAAGSEIPPPARFIPTLPGPYTQAGSPHDWTTCEWINLCSAVAHADDFDIVHSHCYLWGLPLRKLSRAPIVSTMHTTPYDDDARIWALTPDAPVIAISQFQWGRYPHLTPAAVIPHGVDVAQFTFNPRPADYLLWLGRFIPDKGPLEAIQTAKKLGMRLVLAAPRDDAGYYDTVIAPHVDGHQIHYAGFVTAQQRDELLGNAAALLYPNLAPEPFGLVLIESMLCGTPVVATRIGAVPEILDDHHTGILCDSVDDLASCVPAALKLDRSEIRRHAESRFSSQRMARDYAAAYEHILDRASTTRTISLPSRAAS